MAEDPRVQQRMLLAQLDEDEDDAGGERDAEAEQRAGAEPALVGRLDDREDERDQPDDGDGRAGDVDPRRVGVGGLGDEAERGDEGDRGERRR